MKTLTIHIQLSIEPDDLGLHALAPPTKTWIDELRADAERHGATVTVDPVADAKGLRKASKAVGGHARAAKLTPERRVQIARQAADTRWNGVGQSNEEPPLA